MFATKENVFNSENAILNHFLLSLVQMLTPTNKIKLNSHPILYYCIKQAFLPNISFHKWLGRKVQNKAKT